MGSPSRSSVASTRREAALNPIVRANEPTWSRARINALWRMGTLRRLQGNPRAALTSLEQALAYTSERPRSELDRGEILAEIGLARADLGLFEGAIAASSAALELLEQVQLEETPAQADALVGLGRGHLGLRRPAAALAPLEMQPSGASSTPRVAGQVRRRYGSVVASGPWARSRHRRRSVEPKRPRLLSARPRTASWLSSLARTEVDRPSPCRDRGARSAAGAATDVRTPSIPVLMGKPVQPGLWRSR